MKNKLTVLTTVFSLLFTIASPSTLLAQTAPTSQPLVQQADMVYLGKITAPSNDGTGRGNSMDSLDYGGFALGMGADGQSLYFGCHDWHSMLARISIPAIGGTGTIQMPCTAVTNLQSINPGDPNSKKLGGSAVWNGKLIVSAYAFYDGNSTALASHFSMSTNMTSQNGPYRIGPLSGYTASPTDKVGMQAGYMGVIPQEWRSLLGGPMLTGLNGVAIIGRTSFGPTATVFDPDELGTSNHNIKMLVGYPGEHQTLGGYSQANPLFSGADQAGGIAFPAGTRSLLFVGRHATTFCYGPGTNDPSLAGTPDGQGNNWCYDPTQTSKGTHGYPYIHQVWAYDANDLLEVKNGNKQPWDIKPYATWRLTDMNNDGSAGPIVSATYDPATKRFYMATSRTIHVYQVNVGNNVVPPPPVPDTVAPVVSVTAPSSSATVSGSSVVVSANATDNVGVVGVQFKVDGVNLGSEDLSAPFSINWDTTSFSNGNRTLTAVARDAAGNTATASSVTVNVANTTPPPPQTSPVGHWMFDSTSGTTASDSSGNSNSGTLVNGPVWTTGKIGNALSFDGVDDYINLGSPSSLVPGSKITLAGWVNLSDNSVARMIISKDDGGSNPTFIRTQGSSVRCVIGGTFVGDFGSIGTNSWNHVACTYDGANVTLYVNGAVVGSTSKTGSIINNPNNWNIGARQNGSAMPMKGMLDDVRVYNRALTSSEISALASNSGTTDTTKPTVNITAPTSYTAIKGVPILVTADATDNVGVSGVQFKLDGVNLGVEDATAPYSTIWDTTTATEGTHTLTAVARDAAGNTQTSAGVTVTIPSSDTSDTTKPIVSITSPSSNSTVSGSVSISANASDNVGVVGVQFKLNGADLLSEDSTSPYSITWNTDSVSDGSYSLTAVARDAAGNTQTSSSVSVTVANGGEDVLIVPPTISITAPVSGSSVSNLVTVSANASDNVGVVGVQFKLDGVNLLTEDTTAPYSVSWDTKSTTNGSHTLTAVAKDVEGNQTTSSSVSVSVKNESDVPSVLKIGDKIKTTAWINVRSTAGGRYVGSQRTGRTGTITNGPGYANGLTWWKVNFTSGADGWVAEKFITKATIAMTDDDYRKNIANIYLIIKYLQERIAGQN